jgi:Zn-dependent protease with chaperone function
MTNFFQHQETARRRTFRLIVFFALAVLTLVVLAYLLVMGIFAGGTIANEQGFSARDLWFPELFMVVSAVVLLLVGGASAMKISELATGGVTVAMMMGGREVQHATRAAREKRLLNIVEEMSIASGVPMPRVYVLPDEAGINAFAAGYTTGDAVVAVSQGALDYLNRDELQGVVAHEFSHILNGDMRLNIRLIGIVYGILAIALLGQSLMYIASHGRSSSSKKDGRGALILLGLGLYILGIGGVFFGNLIKAAVSRQREFLADASAVQFTRNPDGIGGALKKIGGLAKHSTIDRVEAHQVSHMFFADALYDKRFVDWLATHPPLPDRIRAIDPRWDGEYPKVKRVPAGDEVDEVEEAQPAKTKIPQILPGTRAMPTIPGLPQFPLPVLGAAAEVATQHVGSLTPAAIAYAAALSEQMPQDLRAAAAEPYSARALALALLIDPNEEVRKKQIDRLQMHAEQPLFRLVFKLLPSIQELPDAMRLPLVEVAMPALRQLSKPQFLTFRELMEGLIKADAQIDLFEYALRTTVLVALEESFGMRPAPQVRHRTPASLAEPMRQVLSRLVWEGSDEETKVRAAYDAGMKAFDDQPSTAALLAYDACTLMAFDAALNACRDSHPRLKERIIVACTAAVLHDEQVTAHEAELLRAVSAVLGCPMPPLVAGAAGSAEQEAMG